MSEILDRIRQKSLFRMEEAFMALCQIVLVENQNNKINKQLKSEKRFGLQSKPLLIWKH